MDFGGQAQQVAIDRALGGLVMVWIVAAICTGLIASETRKRRFWVWFAFSILAGPIAWYWLIARETPLREGLRLERTPEPCALVIFGATGDLTRRKLIPALYHLGHDRLLPANFAAVGFARRDWSDESFRAEMKEAVGAFAGSV